MANPQKENGYVPIANEIYDAMALFRIPGECEQVLKVIIRKTYGFNKKADNIANSQICEATGLHRANVSRALSKLITNRLVIKIDNKSKDGSELMLNKNYEQWIPFVIKSDNKKKGKKMVKVIKTDNKTTKKVLSKVTTSVIKTDNKVLSKVTDTKDIEIQLKDNREEKVAKAPTPKEETKNFFEGVKDLLEKKPVPWLSEMLVNLAERNPSVDKRKIWAEVVAFCGYWTERDQDGRQEKWQLQKTFEVWHRLTTWFRNAKFKDFQGSGPSRRQGRGLVE